MPTWWASGLICRLYFHFGVAFCLCLSLERVLVQNISHENDLIFKRMNVQLTCIFIRMVWHKHSFARGKRQLFINELLREPLIRSASENIATAIFRNLFVALLRWESQFWHTKRVFIVIVRTDRQDLQSWKLVLRSSLRIPSFTCWLRK